LLLAKVDESVGLSLRSLAFTLLKGGEVTPLLFLGAGLVCSLIARVFLLIAAVRVGVGWTIGVLFPFGPLLFRLNYPEEARPGRIFRYATIGCLFGYFVTGPGPAYKRHMAEVKDASSASPIHFALEAKPSPKANKAKGASPVPGPSVQLAPTAEERRAANFQEFQRLRVWNDALRLKKRDLLHSDTEGNRLYEEELAQYNAALAKANAEKAAIATLPK
jgi:hypothetical protein